MNKILVTTLAGLFFMFLYTHPVSAANLNNKVESSYPVDSQIFTQNQISYDNNIYETIDNGNNVYFEYLNTFTSSSSKEDSIIDTAKKYLGVKYVWGASSPSGFDCSGFTSFVMKANGITIPRTSYQQFTTGQQLSRAQLAKGDLVFFNTYGTGASHVGIYLGNGQFIHASSGAKKVTISDLSKDYYSQRFLGGRRVIK